MLIETWFTFGLFDAAIATMKNIIKSKVCNMALNLKKKKLKNFLLISFVCVCGWGEVLIIINNGISFYVKIFVLYMDFVLDESYTRSMISIRTGSGFDQNVKSLICIINNTLYYILLVVFELGPYVWHEQ